MSELRLEQIAVDKNGTLFGLDQDGVVWYCITPLTSQLHTSHKENKWRRFSMDKAGDPA